MDALVFEPKNWIALSFLVFLALFFRYAVPPILKALDARSARIRDEIEEAIRLREAAQTLLADFQQKQQEILAEAESILAHANHEASEIRNQAETELRHTVERRTRMAHEKIARAEANAMADIQDMMAELSVRAAREVLTNQLTDEQRDKLATTSLADLKQLVH